MLQCEKCGHEVESKDCGKCGGKNLPDAKYCSQCGRLLQEAYTEKKDKKDKNGDPYDIDNRVLCSDGACIGVINEKGVCTECGKKYEG